MSYTVWKFFKETGNVKMYLLLKKIERSNNLSPFTAITEWGKSDSLSPDGMWKHQPLQ